MPMNAAAVWGSRQYLRLSKEDERGTRKASPTTGDQIYIRLDQDNAFDMDMMPNVYDINSAEAGNTTVQSDYQTLSTQGTLNSLFYPSQAGYLLALIADLASSGTPPVYTPKTVTVDWYDGAQIRSFLGVHVQTAKLSVKSGQPGRWNLNFVGWKEDTPATVSEPAFSVYPTDLPFHLNHSSGALKIGSNTARTRYESFEVDFTNKLAISYCEGQYPNIDHAGKELMFSSSLTYASGQTDRAAFQAHTTMGTANEITFARAGSHTVKLDFRTQVKLTQYKTAHPLEGIVYAAIMGKARYSSTSPAGIFTYTITDP